MITIVLPNVQSVNYVLTALSLRPYAEVQDLIENITKQAREQVKADSKVSVPA